MEYQSFGRSGLKTSRLCFGAMLLSSNGYGPWRMPAVVDEITSASMLDRYVAAGGNFIDTSNNYGESEAIIGNWLIRQNKHARRKLIICTKFTSPVNTIPAKAAINYPNSSGSSRKHIMDAIEDSLEKLQTNYIDVYMIHYWDDGTQLEDVIRTLQSLIQMGRIRYYAVSNYTPVQLQQLISLCERHQWELPVFTQAQYSLLCRTAEWELIRLCQSHGIGFLAWSPLAGGWLSNKYSSLENTQLTQPPANSRMSFAESVHFSSWDLSTMASNPKTWVLLRTCAAIAAELKATVSQVAIRWILAQDIAGCIVGPRTLAHLEDNIVALKLKLTSKHLTMLNEASHTPAIYPYCAFSDLTVKSSPALAAVVSNNKISPLASSLRDYPGLQQLINLSGSFQPTLNRSPWMARLIHQKIYELGARSNPHCTSVSLQHNVPRDSLFRSTSIKLAFVFGGFLTVDEPIITLRDILSHLELTGTVRSFIHQGLELIDQLILLAKKEMSVTWIDSHLNLFEWIRIGPSDTDAHSRPTFTISLPILLMNQLILLMHLLECTNLTLAQLKRFCIFSSGFSIGTVTAYVVDISNNYDELRHNALAAIRLCFWFGLRTTQDFRKWKLDQYKRQLDYLGAHSPPSTKIDESAEINYNTGSLQIARVPYKDVSDAINVFNSTNPFGYQFDVCVVSQFDRVTLSGFSNHLPRLVEFLQLKFPSSSIVSVGLDTPIHCARYFPDTVSKIAEDFSRGYPKFEGTPTKNQWNQTMHISDADGQPSVVVNHNELISNILLKLCRWDLVSDRLAHILQTNDVETSDSSESIVILDFGPGTRSNNLISNNTHLKDRLARGQITVFTTSNLPHGLIAAVGKIHESIINEGKWIRRSICDYRDPVKSSIAIVGMACRFPDANNPDEFYYNLLHKKHSIQVIPRERWEHDKYYDPTPKNICKTNARHMGIIEEIDLFDPLFFNINMRDATHMDPQHRLTLEMCYLALENAGYVISEGVRMGFDEQRVGVFVGCTGTDSYRKNMEAHMDAYLAQCEARSMQAGRVSYFFKFCGPSIQIDTACATGLVCLHLAVESLLSGECDAAVVSSVLASSDPVEYLALAAGGFFSTNSTGGCKAFVSDADGYTRSDGVAAVVIKPYRAALKDRDCIHALINATAVNQSGRSQNLLLPSEPQIESLIQTVLRKAHIPPSAVQFIEAHGTGTQGGDPIEMNAIVKTLGMNAYRSADNPLYVGAHKAFIGHSEAAAGLAGLIKTVMMMQHKTITPHIPIKEINPKIHLQEHMIIPQEAHTWTVPYSHIPRRAVVNSFGFSGANASCVIQETPETTEENNNELIEPVHLIAISGKHPDSIRAYTLRFIQYLVAFQSTLISVSDSSNTECSMSELRFLRDLAFTTTARRTHFPHRLAVVASTVKELIRKLTTLLVSIPDQLERLQKTVGSEFADLLTPYNQGLFLSKDLENATSKTTASSVSLSNRMVFVFGGQGSQYFSMCRQLLESSYVWASTFRLCSELFASLHPTLLPKNMTLLELLQAAHKQESRRGNNDGEILIEEKDFISTQVCQPLLFAVEYSLGKMLMSWGIYPDYIIGHSVGELVGACLASVMSLEDALFLIGHRARLMETTSEGAMMAINCNVDEFHDLCHTLSLNSDGQTDISIAAHNGARSIVVAGDTVKIDILHSHITSGKLFLVKKLNVNHAFHTRFMSPILDEFHSIADKIMYRKGKIPIVDTLSGELRTNFNAGYWTEQLNRTVQFHSALCTLCSLGAAENFQPICIELSPSPILSQYLNEAGQNLQIHCILRKNRSDLEQVYSVVAELYVRQSSTVCWSEFHRANRHARVLSLPNYAFNHKSCWLKLPWVTEASHKETTTTSSVEVTPCVNVPNSSSQGSTQRDDELPLIGKCTLVYKESNGSYECIFSVFDRPWRADIQNHVVASKPLLSIPLYSALVSQFALYATQKNGVNIDSYAYANVKDLMIKSPFIWEDTDSQQQSCREMVISLVPSKNIIRKENSSTMFTFAVASRRPVKNQDVGPSKVVVHSSGTIHFTDSDSHNIAMSKGSFERITSAVENSRHNTSCSLSYEAQEFYKLSSEFGTTYGSHYQSVEKVVISNDALTSWSKQTISANQPYCDTKHLTLIHPSWLDSFVQGATLQVAQIPDLNRPFVAMFVESLVCRMHVYPSSNKSHTGQSESDLSRTQSKFPTFYTENQVRINNPNLITSETLGFDENGKCLLRVTGAIMMSTTTGFNDQNENAYGNSLAHKSGSTENNKREISVSSKKSNDSKESNVTYHSSVQNIILRAISSSLEVESGSVDVNENFANMGIDSLLSIEIRGELKNAFQDITLAPTILFDYSSVNVLTNFIVSLKPVIDHCSKDNDEELEQDNLLSSSIQPDDIYSLPIDEEDWHENVMDIYDADSNLSSQQIHDRIADVIAESLKLSDNTINDDVLLTGIGIDPLLAIKIRIKLQKIFSLHLSSSVIFDYPTLGQLTEFIWKEFFSQNSVNDPTKEHTKAPTNSNGSVNYEDMSSENQVSAIPYVSETKVVENQAVEKQSSSSLHPCSSLPNTSSSLIGSTFMDNSSDNRNSAILSGNMNNSSKADSSLPENRTKISTIKSIYVKVTLPQIIADPDRLYEPFPLVNLCQAYTLGQFLPEMAVRSHVLLIKSFKLNLDADRLEAAWNQCIQRHPMLRCEINSDICFQILKVVPHYEIKRFYSSTESILE
jgi:acyl transferase domain-containing protein/aryl-alcohol dehydrogenase-like predicted oxidoreductase/acyl carrier protein